MRALLSLDETRRSPLLKGPYVLMRLRGLLAGTGIPFGIYVGKTPEREVDVAGVKLRAGASRADYEARLARARRDGNGETVYPAEEVRSREVMRTAGRQPRSGANVRWIEACQADKTSINRTARACAARTSPSRVRRGEACLVIASPADRSPALSDGGSRRPGGTRCRRRVSARSRDGAPPSPLRDSRRGRFAATAGPRNAPCWRS